MERKTFSNSSITKPFVPKGRGDDAPGDSKTRGEAARGRGGIERGRGRGQARGRGRGRGHSDAPVHTKTEIPTSINKSKISEFDPSYKNDPFLDKAFELPVPLQLIAKTITPEIAPDLSGFLQIVEYVYDDLVAINKDFRKEVSPALFLYYNTQLLSLRLIAIRMEQGRANFNEESHFKSAKKDNNPVPGLLDQYLNSIGEFTIDNGTHFRVTVPQQGVADYGRIDAGNHMRYMCHPSFTILTERIKADLANPLVQAWDIPRALKRKTTEKYTTNKNRPKYSQRHGKT